LLNSVAHFRQGGLCSTRMVQRSVEDRPPSPELPGIQRRSRPDRPIRRDPRFQRHRSIQRGLHKCGFVRAILVRAGPRPAAVTARVEGPRQWRPGQCGDLCGICVIASCASRTGHARAGKNRAPLTCRRSARGEINQPAALPSARADIAGATARDHARVTARPRSDHGRQTVAYTGNLQPRPSGRPGGHHRSGDRAHARGWLACAPYEPRTGVRWSRSNSTGALPDAAQRKTAPGVVSGKRPSAERFGSESRFVVKPRDGRRAGAPTPQGLAVQHRWALPTLPKRRARGPARAKRLAGRSRSSHDHWA
jgi:hypothetical protein